MKFYYLAHSAMSLECLEGMIEKSLIPGLVVVSVSSLRNQDFLKSMKYICESHGIPLANISNARKDDSLTYYDDVRDLTKDAKAFDIGVSAGFLKILPVEVFNAPAKGTINLHCGKLPQYRGRAPISRAIMNDDKEIVMTIHMIDSGVDSGDIILEEQVPVTDADDVNTLYEECCNRSSAIVIKALKEIARGKATFRKQSPDLPPNQKISDAERIINWKADSRSIFNKIRAVTFPYPGAVAKLRGKEYIVLHSVIDNEVVSNEKPGTIAAVDQKTVTVCTGNSRLILRDVFRSGSYIKDLRKEFKTGQSFK